MSGMSNLSSVAHRARNDTDRGAMRHPVETA